MTQRDKDLRKKYGITEAEYNSLLAKNDGGCWICGRQPTGRPLHVDHDHKYQYVKITTIKTGKVYTATAGNIVHSFLKKNQAIQAVRAQLKKESVRGLLCWPCNTGLEKYRDDPALLRAAADYLDKKR